MIKQKDLIKRGEWDIIIIIDACRYDLSVPIFKKVFPNYKLRPVDSECCQTLPWYDLNWKYKNDIILISQHPGLWRHPEKGKKYCQYFKGYKGTWKDENWLDPTNTLNIVKKINLKYKILVHLIPPHLPFLGEEGAKLIKELNLINEKTPNVYDRITEYGRKFGWEKLTYYYKENIEYVLKKIKEVNLHTIKRVIITSDHGEIIGPEIYNHNRFEDNINIVPWCE